MSCKTKNKESDETIVSIFCTCYNHGDYIRDCLDGFIMQETDFKFEVLVHDDASTDNSQTIIREYAEKYPEIIKPIFQTINQYSKGVIITSEILLPKAKGKYIAFCEGDDFWMDNNKLQKQYDIFQSIKDCMAVFHKVKKIRYDTLEFEGYIGSDLFKKGMISGKYIIKKLLTVKGTIIHVSSLMLLKTALLEYNKVRDSYFLFPYIGDFSLELFLAYSGNMYYLDEVMSAYRINVPNSWCQRESQGIATSIEQQKTKIKSLDNFNKLTEYKYDAEVKICQKKIWTRLAIHRYRFILNNKHKLKNYVRYYNDISHIGKKLQLYMLIQHINPNIINVYHKLKYKKLNEKK